MRISQEGNPLSLEINPLDPSSPTSTLPIASLPELLTGIGQGNATGLSLKDGKVVLTGSNPPNVVVAGGEVAVTGNLTNEGGAIEILAWGDITTRDLNSSSSETAGGNITVKSVTGKVKTGDINAGSSDNNSNSGNVSIQAETLEWKDPQATFKQDP